MVAMVIHRPAATRAPATPPTRGRHAHGTPGRLTILSALAISAALVSPGAALASDPPAGLGEVRDVRPAWDRQPAIPDEGDARRLIVRFEPGTDATERRTATGRAGVRRIEDLPTAGIAVVAPTRGTTTADAIARLRADPNVRRVSVDHRRYRDIDPENEPGWVELWGLDNHGQPLYQGQSGTEGTPDVDIDGLQAMGVTTGDPAVVVAVIDDGVDFSHPDLAARAWTNPGETGDGKETNGVDDDANGFIDDVNGWDFCHDDNTVHDFDDDFHGTHVAGTIAASLDGVGVVGVAPSVQIMALKFLGNDPACGYDSQAIAAIEYAASFDVAISNNSWGGRGALGDAPELYDAIAASGMLFVASAGNDGIDNDNNSLPSLPSAFDLPNILAVAAIDNEGFIAEFSNYGATRVDIAAPGEGILSALPADSEYSTPGWGWLDGTSMAAPHVAGTAALVVSLWPELADSPDGLKARILGSGKSMPWTAGATATGRAVDAFRALDVGPPQGALPINVGWVIGAKMGRTTAPARVSWPAGTDDLTGVNAYGALVRVGEDPWITQTSLTSKRSTDRKLKIGRVYAFRVRPRDAAGNWGPYLGSPSVKPYRHQETTSLATWKGSWGTSRDSAWSGGKTRYSRKAGASVTFKFTGRAFALVAPKGSTRGKAKLYIDGFYVSTIDLYRKTAQSRMLVAGRTWNDLGAHTVKLVVVGKGSHPRVDVDALLVMR